MSPDPRLNELLEKWLVTGEAELEEAIARQMPAAMAAAGMRLTCADQLAAVLLGGTPQPQEEEMQEDTRVAPLTAGADVQELPRRSPPGAVTAAERTDAHSAQCQTHGDPLVCLACEAEESTRPEWALDLDTFRALARTHRMPRDPFAEQLAAAIFTLCNRVEQLQPSENEPARCSGCGARWSVPEGFLFAGVVHLCGDCWRKVQGTLHAAASGGIASSQPKSENETMSDIPRRCRTHLYVPAETAITAAKLAVEAMAADERLTAAVILLGQAQDKVADFVDGVSSGGIASSPKPERQNDTDHEIDCPLCGQAVRQVASATLSVALWQHVNWTCRVFAAFCKPAAPVRPVQEKE